MAKKPRHSIRARVLGDASITTGVATIEPTAEILFAATLYLILERNRSTSRRTVQALLWPDASARVAAHRMRQTLLKLRQVGVPIELSGKGHIGLNGTPVSVDYEEFLISRRIESESSDALVMLPAYEPRFSQPYLEWLDGQKAEVNASMTRVMLGIIARHRVKGEWVEVERNASRLLRFQPYNEEATLARAEACAMRGGKLEAMAILDRYLSEVGSGPTDLRLPATIMRRRIADRMHPRVETIAGQSPLVGRGAVMEQLAGLLDLCRRKKGQACLVWGDAGIGKSRLLAEFATFASLQGIPTQRVQCRPSDPHRPLSVFVDLVPGLRTMRGAIGCSPETFSYLDRLTQHKRDALPANTPDGDSEFIYAKVQQALFDLFDAVSEEGCLIVLIEDVHWLDSTSAKLFGELVAWAGDHSILFALTAREAPDGLFVGLGDRATEVHLPPLDAEASKDVVLGVVRQHGREIEEKYLDWCVKVAEGNPYFLQELANQWVERGNQHAVPQSLAAVLNDRITRLGQDALLLLQTCALLEKNSTLDRIEKVLGFEAHRMLCSINELGLAGMLLIEADESGKNTADKLLSRHDLLSNAAIARLTPPACAFLHRRVGTVLEGEVDRDFSASMLWDCAEHWQLAGNLGRAFQLAKSCATHLMEVGLPADAADAYEKSLAYCGSPAERLQVLEGQARAYYRSKAWSRVSEVVKQARKVSFGLHPRHDSHDDLELMALRAEWRTLRHDRVLRKSLSCLYEVAASPQHRVEAGSMALMLLDLTCDHDAMPAVYDLVERLGTSGVSVAARLQATAVYHTTCGDLRLGVEAARSSTTEQRKNGNVGDLIRSLSNAAIALRVAGFFDEAQQYLVEALAIADQHRIRFGYDEVVPLLANMALERGRNEEARQWVELLRQRAVEADDRITGLELAGFSLRLALLDKRPWEAKQFLSGDLRTLRRIPVAFRRTYQASLFVAAMLACGRVPSAELLEILKASHLRSRRSIFQAYPAYVLYAGLKSTGEEEHGARLLGEYLTIFRREPWPAPTHLLTGIERSCNLASKKRRR